MIFSQDNMSLRETTPFENLLTPLLPQGLLEDIGTYHQVCLSTS